MGVKVKVKRKHKYLVIITFDFDDRPSKSTSHEGTAANIAEFTYDVSEYGARVDEWEDELESGKDHITEVSLRIVRI